MLSSVFKSSDSTFHFVLLVNSVPNFRPVPITLALALICLVVGIGCELLFLPLSLASTLTIFSTTIALILHPRIGFKKVTTMGTSNLCVHGFPPIGGEP